MNQIRNEYENAAGRDGIVYRGEAQPHKAASVWQLCSGRRPWRALSRERLRTPETGSLAAAQLRPYTFVAFQL
jgi:hypothetical protein